MNTKGIQILCIEFFKLLRLKYKTATVTMHYVICICHEVAEHSMKHVETTVQVNLYELALSFQHYLVGTDYMSGNSETV